MTHKHRCVHVYMLLLVSVCMCVHAPHIWHAHVSIRVLMPETVCMYVCAHVYVSVCMCLCECSYLCVCVCAHVSGDDQLFGIARFARTSEDKL